MVNSKKLYNFLMNNECHLYRDKSDVKAWVAVKYYDLQEFAEIIGACSFDDGGIEVTMMQGYIAVTINDLLEGTEEDLIDYKECFGDEWE